MCQPNGAVRCVHVLAASPASSKSLHLDVTFMKLNVHLTSHEQKRVGREVQRAVPYGGRGKVWVTVRCSHRPFGRATGL